jgi:hypothetical protein
VRLAVPEDRQRILDLTSQLHEENGLFGIAPKKVDKMLDRYFHKDGAIIGAIGEPGDPVGIIYLGLDQLIYTEEWSLVEQFNFVAPEHRHSNYAAQLLCYAKGVSDKLKVPLIVGILSNKRTEAKMRLYDRQLERVGGVYAYNVHLTQAPAWKQ